MLKSSHSFETEKVSQKGLLGVFEELVLRAIIKCAAQAYGNSIREALEEATGRSVSVGALYTTFDRLKEKGFISYQTVEGGAERDNRPKRLYRIENAGKQALFDIDRARLELVPSLQTAFA